MPMLHVPYKKGGGVACVLRAFKTPILLKARTILPKSLANMI